MLQRSSWVAVLVGLPLLALGLVLAHEPWAAGWGILWLMGAGALLEVAPVTLRPDVKTSLANVAILVALLLLGPGAAVGVAVAAGLVVVALLPRRARALKGPYNVAMFVLSTIAATGAYALVTGTTTGPTSTGAWTWIVGVVAAQVAYFLVNIVLLSFAIRVTGGPPVRTSLPGLLMTAWWGQVLCPGLAVLAYVVFVEGGPFALALLLVPLASARRSLAGAETQRDSLDRAVRALVRLVEVKDSYTRGHAERVADLSDRVAARMGLSTTERYWIRIGAVLHDVGKICVPLEVLNKPGGFTEEEYWQMRRHPDLGADLLSRVDALAPAVPLVRQHHERIDGCGYPRGLRGAEVPLATRIVSAVDSWDAMTTTRPYREGLPVEVAAAELHRNSGTQFDAHVVHALLLEVAPHLAAPGGGMRPAAADPQVGRRRTAPLAVPATEAT